MTHLTPTNHVSGNPVAVVLKFLAAAWNDNRVEWTSVPADCRPAQIKLLGRDEADIRSFVAAVEQLAGLFAPDQAPAEPITPVKTTPITPVKAASPETLDAAIADVVANGGTLVVASPGHPPHEATADDRWLEDF